MNKVKLVGSMVSRCGVCLELFGRARWCASALSQLRLRVIAQYRVGRYKEENEDLLKQVEAF